MPHVGEIFSIFVTPRAFACDRLNNLTMKKLLLLAALFTVATFSSCEHAITVKTPGTLSQLLTDYDTTEITELIVVGNLNDEDIEALNDLPNLSILNMKNVKLKVLSAEAFAENESLTSVKLPRTLTSIRECAFDGCESLTSITIPNSVKSIGEGVFGGCRGLTSITLPNSVKSIGKGAFCKCKGLISITISNNVTSIGDETFYLCHSLTSVTIPDGVTTIGDSAFKDCSSLTSVYCKVQTPPWVGNMAFWNVSATLYVPIGRKEAYAAADEWKNFQTIEEVEF